VIWQKQYERQLNALIEQETLTRKSMTEASRRYADLVNKSTVFSTTAESLRDLLSANEARSQQLYSSLWSLAEVVTKTATSLSRLEVKISEMTKQVEPGVRVSRR
jgi:intergrase/recombinase